MDKIMETEHDEFDWSREQTCKPLYDNGEVRIAEALLQAKGLPKHPDPWKSWDNWLAVHHCSRLVEETAPVLDAGACRDPNSPSVFLPGLQRLGFTDLHGCNLDEPEGKGTLEDGVMYSHQNIEKTNYPGKYFQFVACLSTIEHGVNWSKYFAEMQRIIAPGGFLFTSFDYWHNPVDTHGQKAFGVPIKIFTEVDVMQMAVYAQTCGLHLMKRPILRGRMKPVQWMGMEYTFMNLLMRKAKDGE